MFLRRTAASTLALLAAMPVMAEVVELEEINVTRPEGGAFFGGSVALDSGTVAKTGDPIAVTPRAVNVITAQELAARGALDTEQALQYTAGVTAGQWGLDSRSDWYLVRGFKATTLHDGLPARYGFYNDTKPEPFLLHSVEVLKGPASGLYGASAVGGVVNTRSKTAAQASENLFQLQVGSDNRKQAGLDVSGDLNESGTLRYRFAGVLREAEPEVDHARNDTIALAPSVTWQPTADTELTLLANYQETKGSPLIQFASLYGTLEPATGFGNGDFLPRSVFVGEPGFDRFDSEQRALTAMLRHRFNAVWRLDVTARYLDGEAEYQHAWWAFDNYANGRYNPDGTINRTFYRAENSVVSRAMDAYATAEYRLGSWSMRTILGASYARGTHDSDAGYGAQIAPLDPFNPVYAGAPAITVADTPATETSEWGLYTQNRAVLNGRLHLDFGLRYGDTKTVSRGTFADSAVITNDSAWTANTAVLYRFDNGVGLYASYAESFLQEEKGVDVNGDPFKPTEGQQYEAGVKYQPAGTDTLLTAAAFDITKSNMLQSVPGGSIQTGQAEVKGLELEAFHRFGALSVDAGYTYIDSSDAEGDQIAQVPRHAASLWLAYLPRSGRLDGWSFGAGVRYNGEAWDGASTQSTPSYTLYDAAVSYGQDSWQVALNLRNLADERYVTTCQSGACYFGEGRSVALTLTSSF